MFIRAKLALRSGYTLTNKFKLIVLAAYTSRRTLRLLLEPIVSGLFHGGLLKIEVRNPASPATKIIIFLRKVHFKSDYLSVDELLMYNCYRLPIQITPDIIVDGGGNTGIFTMIVNSVYKEIPIHIFEPFKENVDIITKHIKVNDVASSIMHLGVLADKEIDRNFYIRTANSSSFNGDEQYQSKISVPSFNLVKLLMQFPFNNALIKLDIEGAEMEVIPGLLKDLKCKSLYIVGELHNWPLNLKTLRRIVSDNGYQMITYDQDTVCLLFHIYKSDF